MAMFHTPAGTVKMATGSSPALLSRAGPALSDLMSGALRELLTLLDFGQN